MPEPLNTLAQFGLGGFVVAFFIWVVYRRILRFGPDVDAMLAEKDKYTTSVEKERDEYKEQVQARQSVVDQAIELAGLLKDFAKPVR